MAFFVFILKNEEPTANDEELIALLARQTFLGDRAKEVISHATVGVVGLGGGGSHIVQQLAHVGFDHYVLFDGDRIEESNLNRLIGGTVDDVQNRKTKVEIAERMIRNLQPGAVIRSFVSDWQQHAEEIRNCDVVLGCLDGLQAMSEL
ncbi:ThiF family adenylyltransferase [Paenibacillus sp. R14(2021)]|uniref:ThiF family adenylyltransferase n=1 Tax=Paenibacillus sp. R14(2021) TaxID=2859228 RepID=UPI001C616B2A|nr:ThiF family adenylyltransferase [Paenibacillus sp. R14(2021)]